MIVHVTRYKTIREKEERSPRRRPSLFAARRATIARVARQPPPQHRLNLLFDPHGHGRLFGYAPRIDLASSRLSSRVMDRSCSVITRVNSSALVGVPPPPANNDSLARLIIARVSAYVFNSSETSACAPFGVSRAIAATRAAVNVLGSSLSLARIDDAYALARDTSNDTSAACRGASPVRSSDARSSKSTYASMVNDAGGDDGDVFAPNHCETASNTPARAHCADVDTARTCARAMRMAAATSAPSASTCEGCEKVVE